MRDTEPHHVADLLPAYVNSTLGAREKRRVDAHVNACAGCRAELASWAAVRAATVTAQGRAPAPPSGVMEGVRARIRVTEDAARAPSPVLRLSLLWQLLVSQIPLVRKEIWTASTLTVGLGCFVALMATSPSAAGSTFAVFAPIIAAVGIAFIYGPENDPSLEVALSTPTPPRLVLLARLTLVYGYDLALALGATVVLALAEGGVDVWPLISLWIGPMLFLSALALLLSLLTGATAAALVAMSLWVIKLVVVSHAGRMLMPTEVADLVDAFWQANPVLLALATLMFATTLLYVPRSERLV